MSLRILLMMDPLIPVPPRHYGGIERVVADLADGYLARGHDVTLWAAPGSATQARLQAFGREGEWSRWSNARNTAVVSARFLAGARRRFDVVHNFGRLAYLLAALATDIPKVQTYMRPVTPGNMRLAARLGARRLCYTAVSAAIRDTGRPGGGDWRVVYNCAKPERYPFSGAADAATAPLAFLGRLDRCKGAHTAIDVAERLERPLVIAGTISDLPHERAYFEQEVRPRLDGTRVRYIGPVDDRQKVDLLGTSAALLLPVEWEEPFPVVLPEALLCGTPVIGFRRGGIPEGIDHGRTGFICDTADDMARAVGRLPELDRAACRAEGIRRFSDDAIMDAYEAIYRELASR
ncbi:MAG: glycosyltransferase family 4 protein [Vicinamibacterales bacterium]